MSRPALAATLLAATLVATGGVPVAATSTATATAAPLADGGGPPVQQPTADEAAVRALVEAYSAARDNSDATALTALFTADADQLVSSGEWRRGREAVVNGSLVSSQQNQGARTFTIEQVRMVAANVALVDSRYDIAPPGGVTRRMWASWLVVKDGAAWKIAAIRNMLPATPGGPAAMPR